MQRKRIKLCNDNNFFLKIPREIQILILLNTRIINIIQTCKYFYSFIKINGTYDKIWRSLTTCVLDCKLTDDE